MRRLRARLDRLESHAHQTMNSGQELIGVIKDFVDDLQDGISIHLEVCGEKIPVVLRIDPREKDQVNG